MKLLLRSRLLIGTAIVLVLGVITYACKDFLATKAQGTLDETALETKSGVEGALIAAYRALSCTNAQINTAGDHYGCAASNWVWGSLASDDSYKGSNQGDQASAHDIEVYNWSTGASNQYINDKWVAVWEGVVRSNAVLQLLAKVQAAKPNEISAADAQSIQGEAIFLRAHYHFEGWRMWGNIPYYTETDKEYFKPNNLGVDSVGKLIINDLNTAIALLPDAPRDGQVGRATSWMAKAYKGRVQVYMGDYLGAIATLTDVKDNGPYALETSFDHVWTGFSSLANGKETILVYEASVNDGEPNGNNGNFGERLTMPYNDLFCCGFNPPTQNLVNFFLVDASGLPLALSDPTWNASPAHDANFDASKTNPVDPRLDWTVGRNGVPYKDWGLHTSGFIRDAAYSGPYSPKQNVQEKSSGAPSTVGWVPTGLNSVHIHIYRYADLLLLLAEAEVESGSLTNAKDLVNLVRARAGSTAQGPAGLGGDSRLAVPINDPAITWATYKIGQYTSFPDQAHGRLAVRAERRLELAMEGHRFFDVQRWGIADTTINNYVATEKTRRAYLKDAATFVMPKFRYYPIPQLQIDLSKVGTECRLTQNTGWGTGC